MRRCLAAFLLAAFCPVSSLADPPQPIDGVRFAFPGAVPNPASATSAALALSDRWLGLEPFSNPAAPRRAIVAVTPMGQRVSRQDLRADNRDFSDAGGSFDLAGAWAGLPLGPVEIDAYFFQPELRAEDNSYTLGRLPQPGLAATVSTKSTAREMRAGFGASTDLGRTRVGAALEWTKRSDDYTVDEESGSPNSGTQDVTFDGDGLGAQFGARTTWSWGAHAVELGGAARFVPELSMTGHQHFELISGTSDADVSVTRASAWEGGLSLRAATAETFHVDAGIGGAGAQEWSGFGVTAGRRFEWKLGGEFHDARDPWTLRFGGGQEQQSGVPEPRAGVIALGLGWRLKSWSLDLGLTHRTLQRPGEPNSYDDRLLLGISVP